MRQTKQRFQTTPRTPPNAYWVKPEAPRDAPEFYPPAGYNQSIRQTVQGGELVVDTRRDSRGRFQTKVLYDYHLLASKRSDNWPSAQITHRMVYHTWECAQRWICSDCGSSAWAAPGCQAKCLTPLCSGGEMCALCNPLERCPSHR